MSPALKRNISIGILVLTHVSGLIGLQTAWKEWFLMLTPINLLLSFVILIWNHQRWSLWLAVSLLLVGILGFISEVIGVTTGLPFGEYSYGATLGYKWLEVPLMIGVNWAMLIYASNMVSKAWRMSVIAKAIGAALMMVFLDVLIEPVAIAYDFWSWEAAEVPLLNYAGWFGVAFMLSLIMQLSLKESSNNLARWLLVIQLGFFGILNFILL